MTATTPHYQGHEGLAPLSSRYVAVDALPWQPTKYPGVDIKVLMQDPDSGLLTALFRWQPGSKLPLHEHVDIEQTYVLAGRLRDHEGEAGPGEYVWRPAGSRHVAEAPEGALVLSFFLRPNKFMAEPES